MAVYDEFIARFPEFGSSDQTLVQKKLDEATRQLNVNLWGALSDDGIYLLTAQKLARLPFGNAAKLDTKDAKTVYDDELDLLRAFITSGNRAT